MRKSLLVLCVVLVVVGLNSIVRADPITILNPGFDATTTTYTDGWTHPAVAADEWTSNGYGAAATTAGLPPNSASNTFYLVMETYPSPYNPVYLYQATTHPIVAGDVYQLSWYSGIRSDVGLSYAIDYTAGLRGAGDSSNRASVTITRGSLPAAGTLALETLSWTVPAGDPSIGEYVEVYFQSIIRTGSNWYQTGLDSVSLSVTPAAQSPEPGTLALLAAGLAGLLCYAWRKRR